MEADCPFAVCAAMKAKLDDAHVQIVSCNAISNLALDAQNNAEKIDLLLRAGVISSLSAAMAAHACDVNVQLLGSSAMCNLAAFTENALTISQAGGIAAIVQAMKGHLHNKQIQQYGCDTLYFLAFWATDSHGAIAAQGGLDAVHAALAAHSSCEAIWKSGCAVLMLLEGAGRGSIAALCA